VTFAESGAAGYPRERVVVLAPGQVAELDDFATLTVHDRRARKFGLGVKKEMGHGQELKEFVAALKGEPNSLLTWDDASLATMCTFAAQESLRTGEPIYLSQFREDLAAAPETDNEPSMVGASDLEVRG
jgi:hypothetical protein